MPERDFWLCWTGLISISGTIAKLTTDNAETAVIALLVAGITFPLGVWLERIYSRLRTRKGSPS